MSTIEEEIFEYNNTEITRKAVIEAGRRKLDEIRDLGRGILQEHYTDRAQNRISSKDAKDYFRHEINTLPDDERTESYWIAKGIERLDDLGLIIIGNAELKNYRKGTEMVLEEIKKTPADYEIINSDFMRRIGEKRLGAFPQNLIDRMVDCYGEKLGLMFLGLFSIKEAEAMFKSFEDACKQLEEKGFVRPEMKFDKYIPENGPDQHDLMLLNELYRDIYEAVWPSLMPGEMKTHKLYLDIVRGAEAFWAGYMDIFDKRIPESIKKSFIRRAANSLETQYLEKMSNYNVDSSTEDNPLAFFRKYFFGYNGRMMDQSDFFMDALWYDSVAGCHAFKNRVDQLWYNAAYTMDIIRPAVNALNIETVDGETICSINEEKVDSSNFREMINHAFYSSWADLECLKRETGKTIPEEQNNPIKFTSDTTFEEAVAITLAMFLYQSTGTTGEWYDKENNRILIVPDKIVRKDKTSDWSLSDITPEKILEEQKAEETKISENPVKDLTNPAVE